MIGLDQRRRYFLYAGITDIRKSFDGLSGLVVNEMKGGLLSGDVFIFLNRRRNMIKLLVWDRSGFVIYYKRLEKGTFEIPTSDDNTVEIEWTQLVMILEGIKLKSIRKRLRYTERKMSSTLQNKNYPQQLPV
ncbi:MAG TPA: IS66 family insertion sequence element accessory protein TnpB [Saprospiraceae bacterium]|nr:IS66 family insertion sequence element accessory protein TnpB [Saprospiraceae bacterium]